MIGEFLTQNDHLASAKQGALGGWHVSDRPPVLAGLMAPFVWLSHVIFAGQESSQLGRLDTNCRYVCAYNVDFSSVDYSPQGRP